MTMTIERRLNEVGGNWAHALTSARWGTFYLATSADLHLATSGDYLMATDSV
jgi:hypothetical protein